MPVLAQNGHDGRFKWKTTIAPALAASADLLTDMVFDSAGNIFAVGNTGALPYGSDILVMRLDETGEVAWKVQIHNSIIHGDIIAPRLVLDETGGALYVSATVEETEEGISRNSYSRVLSSKPIGQNKRLLKIWKYNTLDGSLLWLLTRTPDNPMVRTSLAHVLKQDPRTGWLLAAGIDLSDSIFSYFLTAIDADGSVRWRQTEGVVQNTLPSWNWTEFIPAYLDCDSTGVTYLGGSSSGEEFKGYFLTAVEVKTGQRKWTLHQPDHYRIGGLVVNAHTKSLVVASGSVIRRFDTSCGDLVWQVSDTTVVAGLAAQFDGSAYYTVGTTSYCTRLSCLMSYSFSKFSFDGKFNWRKVLSAWSHYSTISGNPLIATNSQGEIYLTGIFQGKYGLAKYSSEGNLEWMYTNEVDSGRLLVPTILFAKPNRDRVFIGATIPNPDWYDPPQTPVKPIIISAYDSKSGDQQYQFRFNGQRRPKNTPAEILTDAKSERIYAVSYSSGPVPDSTMCWTVMCLEQRSGNPIWTEIVPLPGTRTQNVWENMIFDAALDHHGGLLLGGAVSQFNGRRSAYMVKLNAESGQKMWSKILTNGIDSSGLVSSIATDDSGNIYIGGHEYIVGTVNGIHLAKLDPAGNFVWRIPQSQAGRHGIWTTRRVFYDRRSIVTVIATLWFGDSTLVEQYRTSGERLWSSMYRTPENGMELLDATVDNRGNVYLTGRNFYIRDSTGWDIYLAKINAAGKLLWERRFGDVPGSYDVPIRLSIDSLGCVYVFGWSRQETGIFKSVLIKFDSTGLQSWIVRRGVEVPWIISDLPLSTAYDIRSNSLYTASSTPNLWESQMAIIAQFDAQTGAEIWRDSTRGRNTLLNLSEDGSLFAASTFSGSEWQVIDVLRYAPSGPTGVHNIAPTFFPTSAQLDQNYPNPFNPVTVIRYSIPRESRVKMKVFNVLGEEVTMLVDERKAAGSYSITWNASGYPSGIYFYRMQTGEYTETRKLLLLR